MTEHTIGVDISKSHLDVFRLEDQSAQRFENSAAGFRALANEAQQIAAEWVKQIAAELVRAKCLILFEMWGKVGSATFANPAAV